MNKLNDNLSEHEMNILKLLAKGYAHKEIAAFLGLTSASAASNEIHRLARKFGVSGQVNVLRMALIQGLLDVHDLRRLSNE